MHKISFTVENKTVDFKDVTFFGTASYLSRKTVINDPDLDIHFDPPYQEALKIWDTGANLEYINALCTNTKKIAPEHFDKKFLYVNDRGAYYVYGEDEQGLSVSLPFEPSWMPADLTQLMSLQKKGLLARTDDATCFCFTMAPLMIIHISMNLNPIIPKTKRK